MNSSLNVGIYTAYRRCGFRDTNCLNENYKRLIYRCLSNSYNFLNVVVNFADEARFQAVSMCVFSYSTKHLDPHLKNTLANET